MKFISVKTQLVLNGFFLAFLPIFEALQMALPSLMEFLPNHIYRMVGLFVVIVNILISAFMPKTR